MGKRTRSPNYPRLSLEGAIERIEKLYKKERTHKTSREAVAEGLGYTSLNGASLGIISTLRQYGLLEEDDDGLRVSEDAVALVMLPAGDPERVAALQKVAVAPRLFAELRETYGETLPSDVSLRYALVKKRFTEKAANEVIRAYRDTLELVSEEAGEYTDAGVENQQEVEPPMEHGTVNRREPAPQVYGGGVGVDDTARVMQFQLPGDSTARIELLGDVTQEAIDMLTAILNAQKLVFPKADQLEHSAAEQSVEQPAIEPPD
jgi:hypothetical protein